MSGSPPASAGPIEYLRAALDPVRLAILGRAAVRPVDAQELAGELGTSERKVLQAIARLREAGLLTDELRLNRKALRELAAAVSRLQPSADPEVVGKGDWTADEAAVLSRFFSGKRLTSIPAQRSKRLVVLERLVQEFEPGLRYKEWQVDVILKEFHEDYVTLRRYLVDEGLLTRERGVYWRIGGRVEA